MSFDPTKAVFHMSHRLTKSDGTWHPLWELPRRDGFPVVVRLLDGREVPTRVVHSGSGWTVENVRIADVDCWKPGSPALAVPVATLEALTAVQQERARQIAALGFTPEHDDCHGPGALVECAVAYANHARGIVTRGFSPEAPRFTPSGTPLRDLIKAAALLIAEIERISRQTSPEPQPAAAA